MTLQSKSLNSSENETTKKAYRKPELVVYGDIREITRNVGKNGVDDGIMTGGGASNKTSA